MHEPPDHSPRIVVVGSINLDLVVRCAHLPRPGETVVGQTLREIPGGKGANQAVAAARLGANVRMIGRVGDDAFGARLRAELKSAGVDDTYVLDTPNCESGIALISVDDAGENSIIVVPGANGRLTPADVAASEVAFRNAQVLLVQLEVPLETIVAAVRMARKHGLPVIVDPAPAVDALPPELLAADVICPNETEAAKLTGVPVLSVDEATEAALWLRDRGARIAIVKRGEHGVVVASGEAAPRSFASFRVDAVDSTAAGDAFAGALGIAMAENQPLEEAIAFACAAGAVAASRPGAQPSLPSREDVKRMVSTRPDVQG
jgi:ribokinase